MTYQIDPNLNYISGAYQEERDPEGVFRWLGERVEIETLGQEGLLFLRGESPVIGSTTVTTSQTSFVVSFNHGKTTIVVPISSKKKLQTVVIEFSGRLEESGDSRSLCFKARELEFMPLGLPTKQLSNIPLVLEHGLLAGNVSATFSGGWLRMSARRVASNLLQLSGILVTPLHRREQVVLTANGKSISDIQYGLYNPDYPYLGNVAFEGRINLADFLSKTNIRFASVYVSDGTPATRPFQDWTWPLQKIEQPLPNVDNMKRIGSSEADWFLFSGASFVEKLHEVTGVKTVKDISVLDWGCGCGRLTRHLIDKGYGEITGIDIDPINIEWCKTNLNGAYFTLVSPDLPSKLPQAGFDLIVGHSVFTHLAEIDQFLWLAELNRLLKPGGNVVVTIMANYSAAIEPFESSSYINLQTNGFLDVGWQNDGVDTQKPGYYRRIFHTVDYILKNWTPFFEVTAVLDGYSDHQAAIVLRKES
jgi:SAM-dependent methyltransferase